MSDYDSNVNRVQELANDPNKLAEHLDNTTSGVYNISQEIAQGMNSAMSRAVSYLNTKIPRPNTEFPMSSAWEPSKAQQSQFNRHYEIVNDPISVLENVKNGTLSNEHMEALQSVHPHLLEEMQQKVMENFDHKTVKGLKYATKIAISKFLGQPLEEGMLPQVIAYNQQVMQQQSAQNAQAQQSQSKPSKKGMDKLDLNKMTATSTQSRDIKS